MMKYNYKYTLLFLIILMVGCNMEQKTNAVSSPVETPFAKGNQINSPNFTGTVWLNMMGATDSTLYTSYGHVTFAPKARTNWHSHPGGQLLFVTEGKGYYQAKGQPARLLKKGDYVEIPPNVVHWHGAASDNDFAHIAVSLNTDRGGAVWIGPVTDEEYLQSTKQ
ncbi:cupin domain-containing protein [Gaoshiqia sediminis]|uniref:Cupin domain-containing protein n=1 Tax=Gaoshiqia sediminis TaxID=2986998 RepID=A0AA41YA80_9BACT|nr:cupin domain-containing protein [Gaoshiqia sediminis]MCW0483823.1 cupin domain-containing protein [Gaoshiqia sediminis]